MDKLILPELAIVDVETTGLSTAYNDRVLRDCDTAVPGPEKASIMGEPRQPDKADLPGCKCGKRYN